MTTDINQLSLSNIKELLQREADFAQQMTSSNPPSGMIEAAVLMLLVEFDNHWQLVLTRRTNSVRDHKGQVSYPGGAREIEDTSLDQTALRETQEEIGIFLLKSRSYPVSQRWTPSLIIGLRPSSVPQIGHNRLAWPKVKWNGCS